MTIVETSSRSAQANICHLLANASFEALPSQLLKRPETIDPMPPTMVFIPYLPGSNLRDTIAATRSVVEFGRQAVPHLPARCFKNKRELSSWLSQIRDTGTSQLLLIAGDSLTPQGPFASTLDIMESGLIEFYGFRTIYVAGHPEGHLRVDEARLLDALALKRAWSNSAGLDFRVVTQFTFDIERFVNWMLAIEDVAKDIPVDLGMAGPTSPSTLAKYALQCGVKLSSRIMLKNTNARKLITNWTPDDLLSDLVRLYPIAAPSGIHLFPFGGIRKTANWILKNTSIQ